MLKRKAAAAICAAAVTLATGDAIFAETSPKRTAYLTFSARFALPGVSLPAGTYVFERADEDISNLVRISNRERTRVYLTAFTTVIERPEGLPPHRHITFREVPRGVLPPVGAWYPAGETVGYQFEYPDDTAQLR